MRVSDCAICGRTMTEPGQTDYPVMEVGCHEACMDAGPRLVAAAREVVDYAAPYMETLPIDVFGTIAVLRDRLKAIG